MEKVTRIERETFDQQLRVFVHPAAYWRRIQLILPDSPRFLIAVDKTPKDLGYNRAYKAAPLSSGALIEFRLAPGQFLSGQVDNGAGHLTLIEEATDPPRGT